MALDVSLANLAMQLNFRETRFEEERGTRVMQLSNLELSKQGKYGKTSNIAHSGSPLWPKTIFQSGQGGSVVEKQGVPSTLRELWTKGHRRSEKGFRQLPSREKGGGDEKTLKRLGYGDGNG